MYVELSGLSGLSGLYQGGVIKDKRFFLGFFRVTLPNTFLKALICCSEMAKIASICSNTLHAGSSGLLGLSGLFRAYIKGYYSYSNSLNSWIKQL